MKKILIVLIAAILVSCNTQKVETENVVSNNKFLIGTWTGSGKFLDVKVNEEIGLVPMEIQINSDESLSGKIGEANLHDLSISKADYGFEIKGTLDKDVKAGKESKRRSLIILFITPDKSDTDIRYSPANFHLKTNFTFDGNMRVGGVNLSKKLE